MLLDTLSKAITNIYPLLIELLGKKLWEIGPLNDSTANDLLRSADETLYAMKHAGRDRIVIYLDLE